jgi:hypothetical protein
MEAIPRSNYVTESHRATLRCKYLGNSGRISVSRYESNTHGKDPNKVIVSWNHALDPSENYAQAVLEYVRRANWGGHWITSTITDGAVGVYAGEIGA